MKKLFAAIGLITLFGASCATAPARTNTPTPTADIYANGVLDPEDPDEAALQAEIDAADRKAMLEDASYEAEVKKADAEAARMENAP